MLQKQKKKISKRGQKICDRNQEEKTREQLKEIEILCYKVLRRQFEGFNYRGSIIQVNY
jgi:hypothetical protein